MCLKLNKLNSKIVASKIIVKIDKSDFLNARTVLLEFYLNNGVLEVYVE